MAYFSAPGLVPFKTEALGKKEKFDRYRNRHKDIKCLKKVVEMIFNKKILFVCFLLSTNEIRISSYIEI